MIDITQRYNALFSYDESPLDVAIIGAGSIGSNLTMLLARLGVKNITVYDFDDVEDHNLGHQAYRVKDIGRKKVDALTEIIKECTDIDVVGVDQKVEKVKTDILVLAVDSMDARKTIFENSDFQFYVDGRMGGETFNIYAGTTFEREKYEKTLYSDEDASDAPCGGKAIGYISYLVSALMEICIKKIINTDDFPFEQNFCSKNLIYDVSKFDMEAERKNTENEEDTESAEDLVQGDIERAMQRARDRGSLQVSYDLGQSINLSGDAPSINTESILQSMRVINDTLYRSTDTSQADQDNTPF
jgi:sulfur carrier protein ThiS adenylyltransferase